MAFVLEAMSISVLTGGALISAPPWSTIVNPMRLREGLQKRDLLHPISNPVPVKRSRLLAGDKISSIRGDVAKKELTSGR